jgi:hypothetical protein
MFLEDQLGRAPADYHMSLERVGLRNFIDAFQIVTLADEPEGLP